MKTHRPTGEKQLHRDARRLGMFIMEGFGETGMESQQADKRIEGLKVLARMIAADYKRRQRAARAGNSQGSGNAETAQKLTMEGERQP